MDYSIVSLPEIAIIGKAGLCTKDNNIAAELWAQANGHFGEVAELGMREANGAYVGFWGAMSDESMRFLPWEDGFSRGMYLAGVEVPMEAEAPEGWTKWVMPARQYLVADVTPDRYGEVFSDVIRRVIPDTGLKLCGAACDYTDPASGQAKLFFPVERLGGD